MRLISRTSTSSSQRRAGNAALPFFSAWTEEAETTRSAPARRSPLRRSAWAEGLRRRREAALDLPRRRRGPAAALAVVISGAAVATLALPGGTASADPSANTWYRLRMCESTNNYTINTGNGYYGAYQFDLSTWRSVGGHGYPNLASKAEQDARALILYRERGWQPWECATILGLREDSDAGSGRISDISISGGGTPSGGGGGTTGGGGGTRSGVPAFPGGSHWYRYGETSRNIKTFQDQMHKRGYFPVGTGDYGPNTLRMVKQLQRLNGLIPNGYIGPNTWRTAWKGTYRAPTTVTVRTVRVPAFPGGSHWYRYGETSRNIKTFQEQMHKRGYFPVGTGDYGPNTLRMVKQLQRLNGLIPNGYIGPKTWRTAWTGKYRTP